MNNSFSYPQLSQNRKDYKNIVYTVNHIESGDDYIVFEHKVIGNGLIVKLLEEKKAKFVTQRVLSSALFRETISKYYEEITPLHVKIKVPTFNTDEKMDFNSYIVYVGEDKEIILSDDDGVDDFWIGEKIVLKKGAILAVDGWRELSVSVSDILIIKKDEKEKYGFNVLVTSNDGGKFIVAVKPDLFDKLKKLPNNSPHKRSIIIHMLCMGFEKLSKEYNEEEFINFKAIKNRLKSANIKTWDEEEFSSNDIACYFYPHIIEDVEVIDD